MSFSNKYSPKNSSEIIGQPGIAKLKDFITTYKGGKAIILSGPPGVGKTSAVYALAKELNLELLEVNASDTRNKASIKEILGSSVQQMSLFGKKKLILVDEVDGITTKDRGGLAELQAVVKKSRFPIVITLNDPKNPKFKAILKSYDSISFDLVNYREIVGLLEKVAKIEQIPYDEMAIKMLATRAGGDVRAALLDLQTLQEGVTKETINHISQRSQEEDIKNGLVKVFRTMDVKIAASAFYNVNEQPDQLKLWIDENLPREYQTKDLPGAYNMLSLADVFQGRIIRRQYWKFLSYVSNFLTVGIALSKSEKPTGIINYKRTMRLLKIWQSNMKNTKRKSIAQKMAPVVHSSIKRSISEIMIFKGAKSEKLANLLAVELELNEDERKWLI